MRNFIGIDIGGTSIKFAVVSEEFEILEKGKIETRKTNTENFILEDIKGIVRELIKRYDIEGIGVSTAGVVDVILGKIIYAGKTIPGYIGTEIKKTLEEEFKIKVEVENDVNSAAIGEVIKGTGKGSSSTFMITVGTGIGGAFLIEDKIFYGASNNAGEIGYMKVDGKDIQDIASTTALVNNVNEKLSVNLDGVKIFNLAEQGNIVCIEEIDRVLRLIAKLIENIIYIINPETIILGGGIMERKKYIEPKIKKFIKEVVPVKFLEKTRIEIANLGNDAGVIGAVSRVI
ncbi:MAG: ROK family protein [Clostridium sp.]|uniref:ROK family protein n=1 Tax=Clostridium sp. TaxID=1506 RepID=UPI003EE67914